MRIADLLLLFNSCQYTLFFFFFNDTATTEIYTLSLHDALPISGSPCLVDGPPRSGTRGSAFGCSRCRRAKDSTSLRRSEEHTSELQSRLHLVCRLLLEKKKNKKKAIHSSTYKSTCQIES